jgi:hypothetical protein
VSYQGHAIYLGKFLGTENDPFGGDLQKIRWERHIPSLTMRGHKVSLGKRVLAELRKESHPSALASDLSKANPSSLTQYRGYHASYNRVRFAARHWDEFSGDPNAFLRDFNFGYVQFEPHDLEGWADAAIWQLVSRAEDLTRQHLHLCCNGESDFETSLAQMPLSLPQVLERLRADMERLRGEQADPVASVRKDRRGRMRGDELVLTVPSSPVLPSHLQFDAAMEQFEESLPTGWRTEWLERLRLGVQDKALELHATATGKHGDVRVRALDLNRPRNLFTMAWRPSDGRFSCRILLDEDLVVACPGVDLQRPSRSDPLKTGFIFDAGRTHEAAFEGLLQLINKAHLRAKEAGL